MIVCPACKEEIEDDSHFCDQCGQGLLFCNQCGRVGLGRRCTYCGGMMVSAEEHEAQQRTVSISERPSSSFTFNMPVTGQVYTQQTASPAIPVLTLANDNLNIRIVGMDGAIIGRRQGPYVQFFEKHAYVSGVHAQLRYKPNIGWTVIDKHSSNGTKINQHLLPPDVEKELNNGDILTLANINLQVIIR